MWHTRFTQKMRLYDNLYRHKSVFLDFGKFYDVRYFYKGLFPSSKFPRVFSQVGNFPNVQFLKRKLPKYVLATALGPLAYSSRSARPPPYWGLRCLRRPNLTFGKLYIWEVATWEIVTWLAALGKIIWENTLHLFNDLVKRDTIEHLQGTRGQI